MPCGITQTYWVITLKNIHPVAFEVHALKIRCLTGTRKNAFAIAVSQSPKRYPDIEVYKDNTYDNPVAQPSG